MNNLQSIQGAASSSIAGRAICSERSPEQQSSSEVSSLTVEEAKAKVERVIQKVQSGDPTVALDRSNVEALAAIRKDDAFTYEQFLQRLKLANSRISVQVLTRLVNDVLSASIGLTTHNAYALTLVQDATVNGYPPKVHGGVLHKLNPKSSIWEPVSSRDLVGRVTAIHDGAKNCARTSDYNSIVELALDMCDDSTFFLNAPTGVACREKFYRVSNGEICAETLTPEHRQRVRLNLEPSDTPKPLFDRFIAETFRSEVETEEQEQVRLLQEIVGAIMLGLLPQFQKAILFYDPVGRSGKGTLERIIRRLVPDEFVKAVSPLQFGDQYYLADLCGARLNVVGELPQHPAIPADKFKALLGGDMVTGRHAFGRPIKFTNEAAHLFMSNHLVRATSMDAAFLARWLMLEFPNSRLRSGLPIDPDLAQNIIQGEMAGIAHWALVGAARLLKQKKFSKSTVHDRLVSRSQLSDSDVADFIQADCTLEAREHTKKTRLHKSYLEWCARNSCKPVSKSAFYSAVLSHPPLSIQEGTTDGYGVFRGVILNSELAYRARF